MRTDKPTPEITVILTRTATIVETLTLHEVPSNVPLDEVAANYTDYLDETEIWETGDYIDASEFKPLEIRNEA